MCPDALLPDGDVCPRCGGPRGPSGCDGGSWVHLDTRPDHVVMTEIKQGYVTQHLANGVKIRWKQRFAGSKI